MVYDFHSHVLPAVDDGAKSVDISAQMLKKSAGTGVDAVLLSSHCYPNSENDIEKYINLRNEAMASLPDDSEFPQLYKGCEVHLTGDLSRFSNIDKLCIENTRYMLLEMPVSQWKDTTLDNVYKLTLKGILPIIAHDERNMHQRAELRNALYDLDVLIQINAPSLRMRQFRKEIDRLMRIGMAHVIGTDMHNMTSRKPCMDSAKKIVEKRYGKGCWEYLMNNAERILCGEEISYRDFKNFRKKGIFQKNNLNT